MFSSKERLIKRTGKNKVGRFEFLKQLAREFKNSGSKDAKEQVLANLANFAYDPINYEFIRKLHIIDIFLDELENESENIVEYSIGGICNLCLDITCPEIVECIVTHLRNPNGRIKNLASIYLETCCSKKQVTEATRKVDLAFGKLEAVDHQ